MELRTIKEELGASIEFDLEDIGYNNKIQEIGSLCEDISENYRSLAICRLLLEADTDGFYHDLLRSAQLRLYYLTRCHHEKYLKNPRIIASESDSFFDALAVKDFDLAKRIAELSSNSWWPDDEYEEDFYYSHLVHKFIMSYPDWPDDIRVILENFENSLQGDKSARLDLCKGLVSIDQAAFDEAFYDLIDERKLQIEREREMALADEISFQVGQHVFIEGLALLRIAERIGLVVQQEYLYCPSLCSIPMKKSFPFDGYPRRN